MIKFSPPLAAWPACGSLKRVGSAHCTQVLSLFNLLRSWTSWLPTTSSAQLSRGYFPGAPSLLVLEVLLRHGVLGSTWLRECRMDIGRVPPCRMAQLAACALMQGGNDMLATGKQVLAEWNLVMARP